MSEYAVQHFASLELCPSHAITCWVDVYDRSPSDEGAVRLRCGYIHDAVEVDDLLAQLEAFLPLERWEELLICRPGDWLQARKVVSPDDLTMDTRAQQRYAGGRGPRLQTQWKLDTPHSHNMIFHSDSKQQLVIVRKKYSRASAEAWHERWPKATGRDYE